MLMPVYFFLLCNVRNHCSHHLFLSCKDMAEHNDLGKEGEVRASLYLLLRGYHILARNWRGADCEVDIIADDYGEVVFVEVKTRMQHGEVLPEEAVTANRMYRMSRAAEEFLAANRLRENPFRFDIIALTKDGENWKLRHLKQAFLFRPKKPVRPQ